jgi:hypothetical protein
MEEAERDQRGSGGRPRIPLETHVPLALLLQLDREHDRRRDLRAGELHHVGAQGDADLRVACRVVVDLQLRIVQLVGRELVPSGLFVAGRSTDFRIECRRPCGTGVSSAPIRLVPASSLVQPTSRVAEY